MYADFLRDVGEGDEIALNLAKHTLEQAKTRFPSSANVWYRLFRLHEQRGHRDQAQATYREYLNRPDADPATAESMASFMKQADDAKDKQALALLHTQRFDAEPENPFTARNAADNLHKRGDKKGAIDILSRHIAANPASIDMRVRLGILLLDDQQNEAGEKELLEVLRIDAEKHIAHQALAKFYDKQNKIPVARHHRTEVLRIRGGDEEEFIALAQEWLAAKDPTKATTILEQACTEFTESQELAWMLAVAVHENPQSQKKTVELFRKAAAINTKEPCKNPYYLTAAAEAFWDNGDQEEAEKTLRSAITLYPRENKTDAPRALRKLASWWQAQGKNEQAAKALLERAAALEK
jgi:predicted Zn-dependent protease